MQKLTNEEFLLRVRNVVKAEYEFMEEYKKANIKIKVRHKECGCEYMVKPSNFFTGKRCPRCSGNLKKTIEVFIEEIRARVGDKYSVLGQYKNTDTKTLIIHNECGHIFSVTPAHFLSGTRCPKCFGRSKGMTHEEFIERIKVTFNGEIVILSKYENARTKVLAIHLPCQQKFKAKAGHLLNGHGCPRCGESMGERLVAAYLTRVGLPYIRQHREKRCRDKRPLPFDFAIQKGDTIVCFLEYQGSQHFEPEPIFGGELKFKDRQRKDQIKRDFCKKSNIPLIEIPYTVKDIETYLGNELKKLAL